MTPEQRAEVVELLLCAADVDGIAAAYAALTGVDVLAAHGEPGGRKNHPTWELAVKARKAVADDGEWTEYRYSCLEAAARIEAQATACAHEDWNIWRWSQPIHDAAPRNALCSHRYCIQCDAVLSMGPSDETDPPVTLEIRAAELAAAWTRDGAAAKIASADEMAGWGGWPYRQPTTAGEWAGFLAAQIVNHERDLGDVNWAGQHMADHPVDQRNAAEAGSAEFRSGEAQP